MKVIVEAPRKKIISFSALGANYMGKTKSTAPYRESALSMGTNTIWPFAQKPSSPSHVCPMWRRKPIEFHRMYYMQHLQQAQGKAHHKIHHTAFRTSITPVNINDASQFPPLPPNLHPFPAPHPPSSSYSRIVTHRQQPINTTEQLSININEFKTMFSQLIQQNGMILNMISTVIQKLTI